jgi:hypothetical protein
MGVLKEHPFFIVMLLSFAPPKESNQRKRVRKIQPIPVFRQLRKAIFRSKKQGAVRKFSGFALPRSKDLTLLKIIKKNPSQLHFDTAYC